MRAHALESIFLSLLLSSATRTRRDGAREREREMERRREKTESQSVFVLGRHGAFKFHSLSLSPSHLHIRTHTFARHSFVYCHCRRRCHRVCASQERERNREHTQIEAHRGPVCAAAISLLITACAARSMLSLPRAEQLILSLAAVLLYSFPSSSRPVRAWSEKKKQPTRDSVCFGS